jgi:hypothetical protein
LREWCSFCSAKIISARSRQVRLRAYIELADVRSVLLVIIAKKHG